MLSDLTNAESAGLLTAFGPPVAKATWKARNADFRVEELWQSPEEGGEHILLLLEKDGQNTEWVSRQLARFAGVRDFDVGFHGLKDRNAITRQWFSVYLGKRDKPDWTALAIEGCRLLELGHTRKKLRRGEHQGNAFDIRLTDIEGNHEQIEERLKQIAQEGFPNSFGPQRFGREGQNILRADAWFAGMERPKRHQKGMLLSAARSWLFNRVLQARIELGNWSHAIEGDEVLPRLDMQNSARGAEPGQMCPTGPMLGGAEFLAGAAGAIEQRCCEPYPHWLEALHKEGVRTLRRPFVALAESLEWEWDEGSLRLRFKLANGCFASALLAQCFDLHSPPHNLK